MTLACLASASAAGSRRSARLFQGFRPGCACPGRDDTCSTPLPTTALNPNGYGSTGHERRRQGPADRLLLRLSDGLQRSGMNSDLILDRRRNWPPRPVRALRLGLRTFAPIYRQMTLALIAAYTPGPTSPAVRLAYGDVVAAWRNYLATRNQGRPFVLIGHSQGSLMLQPVDRSRDRKESGRRRRMKLAIIAGFNVLVPQGKLVGGSSKRPRCAAARARPVA